MGHFKTIKVNIRLCLQRLHKTICMYIYICNNMYITIKYIMYISNIYIIYILKSYLQHLNHSVVNTNSVVLSVVEVDTIGVDLVVVAQHGRRPEAPVPGRGLQGALVFQYVVPWQANRFGQRMPVWPDDTQTTPRRMMIMTKRFWVFYKNSLR